MAFADEVNLRFDGAAPWKLVKEGKGAEAAAVCSECLEMFKVLTACLKPVLPELALHAEAFLKCAPLDWANAALPLGEGHQVGDYKHLMQRVDAKQLDALFEPPPEARQPEQARSRRRRTRAHHHHRRLREDRPAHREDRELRSGGRLDQAAAPDAGRRRRPDCATSSPASRRPTSPRNWSASSR